MYIQLLFMISLLMMMSCGGGSSGGLGASSGASPLPERKSVIPELPDSGTIIEVKTDPAEDNILFAFDMGFSGDEEVLYDKSGKTAILPPVYSFVPQQNGYSLLLSADHPNNYLIRTEERISFHLPTVFVDATVILASGISKKSERLPLISSYGEKRFPWEWGFFRKGNALKSYFRIQDSDGNWNEVSSAAVFHFQKEDIGRELQVGFYWTYGKVCFQIEGELQDCVIPFDSRMEDSSNLTFSTLALGWNDTSFFEGELLNISLFRNSPLPIPQRL